MYKDVLYSFNLIDENAFNSICFVKQVRWYDKMIINHNSYFAKLHNITYIICCFTSSYAYAYMTIFTYSWYEEVEDKSNFKSLLIFYEIFFVTSMVLTFLTSYQNPSDKTQSVRSFPLIAKRYLKTNFIIDFIPNLPF